MTQEETAWLAGLLEGEGSFLKGPPSAPNQPRISVEMTDEDVIARVARLFGVAYVHARRNEQHGWKPSYTAKLKGAKAVALMRLLRPHMGARRQAQIDVAVASFSPRVPKVSADTAAQIRAEYGTAPAKVLAEKFHIHPQYLRRIAWGKQRVAA